MTRQQFIEWAKSRGWEEDKWGHLRKGVDDSGNLSGNPTRLYRFKLSSIAVRYEIRVHHEAGQYGPASSSWMRLRSGYFRDLGIDPDGRLRGLK